MNPKPELIEQWQKLMSGIKQFAIESKTFSEVKVLKDMTIVINKDWKIKTYFINNKFLQVHVYYKKEGHLEVRHMKAYNATINIVLNYINLNQD